MEIGRNMPLILQLLDSEVVELQNNAAQTVNNLSRIGNNHRFFGQINHACLFLSRFLSTFRFDEGQIQRGRRVSHIDKVIYRRNRREGTGTECYWILNDEKQ